MRRCFDINYEKNKVLYLKEVNEDALMINIIELKKQNYKIVVIKDMCGEYHKEEEITEIYKESIDIEYEDVATKKEAYSIAYKYYKNLYNNKYIERQAYYKYRKQLNKYRKEYKDRNIFIEKVKEMYISGV